MEQHTPFHPVAVGQRLTCLREHHQKTRAEFAESVRVDPTSYGRIEKGLKPLKADMAYRIAERWNVSMDFLYRGSLVGLPDNLADKVISNLTSNKS